MSSSASPAGRIGRLCSRKACRSNTQFAEHAICAAPAAGAGQRRSEDGRCGRSRRAAVQALGYRSSCRADGAPGRARHARADAAKPHRQPGHAGPAPAAGAAAQRGHLCLGGDRPAGCHPQPGRAEHDRGRCCQWRPRWPHWPKRLRACRAWASCSATASGRRCGKSSWRCWPCLPRQPCCVPASARSWPTPKPVRCYANCSKRPWPWRRPPGSPCRRV